MLSTPMISSPVAPSRSVFNPPMAATALPKMPPVKAPYPPLAPGSAGLRPRAGPATAVKTGPSFVEKVLVPPPPEPVLPSPALNCHASIFHPQGVAMATTLPRGRGGFSTTRDLPAVPLPLATASSGPPPPAGVQGVGDFGSTTASLLRASPPPAPPPPPTQGRGVGVAGLVAASVPPATVPSAPPPITGWWSSVG